MSDSALVPVQGEMDDSGKGMLDASSVVSGIMTGVDALLIGAGTDATDTIDVTFTPDGIGDPIIQPLVVQGIRHELTPESHRMTLSTIAVLSSTGDEWDIGVWGTAEWQ